MNKILLLFVIVFAASILAAQTGLFEISYGASRDDVLSTLADKGFTVSNDEGSDIILIPDDNYKVDSIVLSFSSDNILISWAVYYNALDDEDIESIAIDALSSWHGSDFDYDENTEEYTWDLGDGHYVYAYYDDAYEYFCVQYTNEGTSGDSEDYDFSY
jgi:hypothetical protein